MSEINNLDRDALFAQCDGHRCQDERRRRVPGEIRFLQFRPPIKTQWLKNAGTGDLFIDEIRHRTGEMTRHRQKSDPEFVLVRCRRAFGIEKMKINRGVQHRNDYEPADRDTD